MKRIHVLAAVGAVMVAGVVTAAAYNGPWSGIDPLMRWMKVGFFVGTSAPTASANKVSGSAAGCRSWDFPVLGTGGVECSDSATVALVGAVAQDPCSVTSDFGVDGGAGLDISASLSCRVTAAGVGVIRACVRQPEVTGAHSWDFPAIGGVQAPCADSSAFTATGAVMGDPCVVGTNLGVDGGAVQSTGVHFECYPSAADLVVVRACATGGDAGSIDPPDAGFFFRTFGRTTLDLPDAGYCARTFSNR